MRVPPSSKRERITILDLCRNGAAAIRKRRQPKSCVHRPSPSEYDDDYSEQLGTRQHSKINFNTKYNSGSMRNRLH
jgi:hypothetical protein